MRALSSRAIVVSSPSIGALRHRLRLEAPVDLSDGVGGFERTYRTISYVWAMISSISAHAQFIEQRFEQSTSIRVDLRWRSDIAAGMRLVFRDRILLIHAVQDVDGTRRFLTCACEEIS